MAKSKKPRKAYRPKMRPVISTVDVLMAGLDNDDPNEAPVPIEAQERIKFAVDKCIKTIRSGTVDKEVRMTVMHMILFPIAGAMHKYIDDQPMFFRALQAIQSADARQKQGKSWLLTGPEMQDVVFVLEEYQRLKTELPHRDVLMLEAAHAKQFPLNFLAAAYDKDTANQTNPINQLESSPGSNRSGRVEPVHNQLLVA